MKHYTLLAALVLAAAPLALVGCNKSSDNSDASNPPPSSSMTDTNAPAMASAASTNAPAMTTSSGTNTAPSTNAMPAK